MLAFKRADMTNPNNSLEPKRDGILVPLALVFLSGLIRVIIRNG
jgi:hypothetical protein